MIETGDRVKLKVQGDFIGKEGFVNAIDLEKVKVAWDEGSTFWVKTEHLCKVEAEDES